ncbi:MAG: peptide-methionine (R)-S-oxide reductase MsrB [Alphaproteobacteria bacterium]|nr:peptide-methionine (R)-S-oxide reductase MsrB [Alphaproteobacteria bacterium]
MADKKIIKQDQEWKAELSPEQYYVCRLGGTEPPFSGKYADHKEEGSYACAACGVDLFTSYAKYDSGSGWPSFFQPASVDALEEREDKSHGMRRIEIRCARCEAHLGHVFPDGPKPTGLRYCINSVSLNFHKKQ